MSGGGRRPNRQRRSNNRQQQQQQQQPDGGDDCQHRHRIPVSATVFVVQKQDQTTGRETQGVVERHLTNSSYHPRGIKVMLTSGIVGRVTRVATTSSGVGESSSSSSGTTAGGATNVATRMMTSTTDVATTTTTTCTPPAGATFGDYLDVMLASNRIKNDDDDNNKGCSIVDETALAKLVDEMGFDADKAREVLLMYDNHVDRAVSHLLQQAQEQE